MGPSGQQEVQGVLPVLAEKSHESRTTFAHVVERKGPVDSTTRRLVTDLDGWDCRDWCSLHQEPAILALKHAVRESMSTVEFVMEQSLVEEHQSNGTIEVTVREIQKQIRVMKSALGKERMKCEVLSMHPILAFFVEHAGLLMPRYQVGRDGRTTYELHAGQPYRR